MFKDEVKALWRHIVIVDVAVHSTHFSCTGRLLLCPNSSKHMYQIVNTNGVGVTFHAKDVTCVAGARIWIEHYVD